MVATAAKEREASVAEPLESPIPLARAAHPTGAPLLVGVIGKRDLRGLDAPLRAALDHAFEELDRRLPDTPKILMSGLAVGADIIAAEAALAREDWQVVAPLPFPTALYEDDFPEAADLERIRAQIAHPRVHVIELAPLRHPDSARRYTHADLRAATPSPPHRTLHYEQAGLFIIERCALLIAVADAEQDPGRIGGTDRMLQTRLAGPDAIALDVRARSAELLTEGSLVDPRTGPVWRIDLEEPALPITVQLPGEAPAAPLGRNRATADSLELAVRLDEFNRRTRPDEPQAPSGADASARLSELRRRLTQLQSRMKGRVRRSVWTIAALFVAAILSLEFHVTFSHYDWSRPLAVSYFVFAAAAAELYVWASLMRWQPLAEDYRAVAEALRAQIVLWDAGFDRRGDRVDLRYLRGMRGAFRAVRDIAGQLVEGARLLAPPPLPKPQAVTLWMEGQLRYFRERIADHTLALGRAHTVAWFFFVFGLTMSACLAAMQISPIEGLFAAVVGSDIPLADRWAQLAVEFLIAGGLFAITWRMRVAGADRPRADDALFWRICLPATGAIAGLIVARALGDVAALLPEPHHLAGAELGAFRVGQAEELMVMCAVSAAAIAVAIRFAAEKLSWEAELQGFEHAEAYFARACEVLSQLADAGPAASRQRREIIVELVEEALRENESWLFAHRERPLEPVVGG